MTSFYGVTLQERRFGGIRVVETRHAPAESIPLHEHVRPFLSLVLGGAYEELVGGSRRDHPRLSAAFHPAGERRVWMGVDQLPPHDPQGLRGGHPDGSDDHPGPVARPHFRHEGQVIGRESVCALSPSAGLSPRPRRPWLRNFEASCDASALGPEAPRDVNPFAPNALARTRGGFLRTDSPWHSGCGELRRHRG